MGRRERRHAHQEGEEGKRGRCQEGEEGEEVKGGEDAHQAYNSTLVSLETSCSPRSRETLNSRGRGEDIESRDISQIQDYSCALFPSTRHSPWVRLDLCLQLRR